jgi:hypothetical protein
MAVQPRPTIEVVPGSIYPLMSAIGVGGIDSSSYPMDTRSFEAWYQKFAGRFRVYGYIVGTLRDSIQHNQDGDAKFQGCKDQSVTPFLSEYPCCNKWAVVGTSAGGSGPGGGGDIGSGTS